MFSLAVGTHLDSLTSIDSHRPILQGRMCPDVAVLAARGTLTALPLRWTTKRPVCPQCSPAEFALLALPMCKRVFGSSSANCDSDGGGNGRPHTDNLDRWQRFLITLVRSACPFKYQYCSMQARYISSYQSIPVCSPERNGFCEHPVLGMSN
jgi:hypothetical protein